MAVLIDTSIFLSLVFAKDANHLKARNALRNLRDIRFVPAPVAQKLFYLATVLHSNPDWR